MQRYDIELSPQMLRLTEIDEIDAATKTLHEMCLDAVEAVLDQDRFEEFGIPPRVSRVGPCELGKRRTNGRWAI